MEKAKATTRREVKKIIIHSSASAFGNAALIDSWHREKGWDSIGYHKVILNGKLYNSSDYEQGLDGVLETGRADNIQGAHCKGQNKESVGICLIGNPYSYTPAQYKMLASTIAYYKSKYEGVNVYLHSEFDKKKPECPGINVVDLIEVMAGG